MPFEPFIQPEPYEEEPYYEPYLYEGDEPEIMIGRRAPIEPDPKRVWYLRTGLWLVLLTFVAMIVLGTVIEVFIGIGFMLFIFWAFISGAETMFGGN